MKKTKIVCTLGPATDDITVLEKVMAAGMNVARLNFSHGNHDEHKKRIDAVKTARAKLKKNVAIMLDTKGPEIRIKQFASGAAELKAGDEFCLVCEDVEGNAKQVALTYLPLCDILKADDVILADDGLIRFKVKRIEGKCIVTEVEVGGELKNNKSLNLPGIKIPMPALTSRDEEDILFGIENGIDFIAASFIRSAKDIFEIRAMLEKNGGEHIKIISKIENREGVNNLEDIVRFSDGIMVARGDLGVEIPPEEVPLVQKTLIKMCNEAGKPVITATQMLDSMIRNPSPTRAEVADVANAVLDGTDAVMLSGETAAGKYPVESVETMARIAERAEEGYKRIVKDFNGEYTVTNIVSYASCFAANTLGAKAVITPTSSGYTPKMVSKYRPDTLIIAVSEHERVVRQLALSRGVIALELNHWHDFEQIVNESIILATENGYISEGDLVVITSGLPAMEKATTNTVRIETAGHFVLRGTAVGSLKTRGPLTVYNGNEIIEAGSIVATDIVNENLIAQKENIAGIVTTLRGISSKPVSFALENNITVLSGVAELGAIPEGTTVEIDPQRNIVYKISY